MKTKRLITKLPGSFNLVLLALGLLVGVVGSEALSQEAIPAKTLDALKAATVYIKVAHPGPDSTGSGFLLSKSGKTGFIVTNAHVIESKSKPPRIQVVFGSGLKDAVTLQATVVAEDESTDLAILRVESNQLLPAPIELEKKDLELRETQSVYILGYPFGAALAASSRGPATTIGKGSVSSIRRDDDGNVEVVQIDGDINPGNSGGPVVSPSGKLIGISVATVRGTQIGLAIPARDLSGLLKGRVKSVSFKKDQVSDGRVRVTATAKLVDPESNLRSVSVLLIKRDRVKKAVKRNDDGPWRAISSNMREQKLTINGDSAVATFEVAGELGSSTVFHMQTKYVRRDGTSLFSGPGFLTINFDKKRIVTAPKPTPKKREKDDWLGSPRSNISELSRPVKTGTDLLGSSSTVVDAELRSIKLKGEDLIDNMIWSEDADYVYLLENQGLLRKIAVPSFKEEVQLKLASSCSSMVRSKAGLLVLDTGRQSLWVVDENDLKVKKQINIANADHVTSAPNLSVAFVSQRSEEHILGIVDLKKGEIVSELQAREIHDSQRDTISRHETAESLAFGIPTVSPDGKYFFSMGSGSLHRFSIRNMSLVYEEAGPSLGDSGRRIEISPDSKYVAMPNGAGNRIKDNLHTPFKGYGTYVYRVNDLMAPVISINSGAYPRALAMDKKAGWIYAQNNRSQLITYSLTGSKLKEYKFPGSPDLKVTRVEPTRSLLAHPGGKRLLVLIETRLFWVQLNDWSPNGPEKSDAIADSSNSGVPKVGDGSHPSANEPQEADRNASKPFKTGTDLLGEPFTVLDAQVSRINLDEGSFVENLIWSKQADYVFVLHQSGTLSKLAVPSFREELRLKLPGTCSWIDQSKLGLVVLVSGIQELWVIDEADFNVKKRIPIGAADRVTSASNLSFAFASTDRQRDELTVVDLGKAKVEEQLDANKIPRQQKNEYGRPVTVGFNLPTVSPDGSFLISEGDGSLHRFNISGTVLTHEETGPEIVSKPSRIEISPDSKYVSVVSGKGNRPDKNIGLDRFPDYGTYIFKANDLRTAVIGIQSGAFPQALAMDRKAALIYAQNRGNELVTFSARGVKQKEYAFKGPGSRRMDSSNHFLVHPKGHRLLVMTKSGLFWVMFDAAKISGAGAPNTDSSNKTRPMPRGESASATPEPEQPKSTESAAIKTGAALFGETAEVDGARVAMIDVDSEKLVENMIWSKNADHVFTLNREGILRKIAVPSFEEKLKLMLPGNCSWIDQSKEGLLVVVAGKQELWVLDEENLEVRHRVPISSHDRASSARNLSVAFVSSSTQVPGRHSKIMTIDLTNGESIKESDVSEFTLKQIDGTQKQPAIGRAIGSFGNPVVSPDGKYLFCESSGRLCRFKIRDSELDLEEVGPRIGKSNYRIEISSDSRYVALADGSGNRYGGPLMDDKNHVRFKDTGTYIYIITDLQKPVLGIESGPFISTLAMNAKAGLVYAQNRDCHVATFSSNGLKQKEYRVPNSRDSRRSGLDPTRYFLVHPDGDRLLILSSDRLLWMGFEQRDGNKSVQPKKDSNPVVAGTIGDSEVGWLGTPVKEPTKLAGPELIGKETGLALLEKSSLVGNAEISPLKLDVRNYVPNMVWSFWGEHVFILDRRGNLRKISVPEFREERLLEFPGICSSLAVSKEGLLLVYLDPQLQRHELLVIDEKDLAVKKRISIPPSLLVASSRDQSIAYVSSSQNNDRLTVVDLRKGESIKELSANQIFLKQGKNVRIPDDGTIQRKNADPQFRLLKVSPDGQYLFSIGNDCLHRFKIDDTALVYEERGPALGTAPSRIEISSDSKYVAVPTSSGNRVLTVGDKPTLGKYSTYLFKTTDIIEPILGISHGSKPTALAIDAESRTIYAQNYNTNLIAFSPDGTKRSEFVFPASESRRRVYATQEIFVHPDGNQMVVRTSGNLYWVKLTKEQK